MKTFNTYIQEKLLINKNYKEDYFIYKLADEHDGQYMKIFEPNWYQFKDYKDKVYMYGEKLKIDNDGGTEELFSAGEYKIYIDDIDKVVDCDWMFSGTDIFIVPEFNTSNVKTMQWMFSSCEMLEEVNLLNLDNVMYYNDMFRNCDNLNAKTKRLWSKVYDFKKNAAIR